MENNNLNNFIERRKGPDLLIKAIRWLAVLGWFIMLAALVIYAIAKPHTLIFFDREYNIQLQTVLNIQLATFLFYLMVCGLLMSIGGFYLNIKRSRRKDDEYRISLILLGMISLLGIITYLISL